MEPNQEIQNETTAQAANGTAEATSEVTSANPMSVSYTHLTLPTIYSV